MATNITPYKSLISASERAQAMGQNPVLIWFTGLSGAGKSTLATRVERALFHQGLHTYYLDADETRQGMNSDVGFDTSGRHENMRRVGHLCRHLLDSGLIVLASFISPFERDRALVRELIAPHPFAEVYLSTSLDECERRDPKGLYKRARAGEIRHFTGLSAPYEAPSNPLVELKTDHHDIDESVDILLRKISERCLLAKETHKGPGNEA